MVLDAASSLYVAHLEDDDLWFPNHLAEIELMLQEVDFGHTIMLIANADRTLRPLLSDLGNSDFRNRFLTGIFNTIGYSVCGYRLDAYRRLPEGWAPTPPGIYPDLHMWRKFLRVAEFRFATRMAFTCLSIPSYTRQHLSEQESVFETNEWLKRIADPEQRAKIVSAGWAELMAQYVRCDCERLAYMHLHQEAQVALARVEELHPGMLGRMATEIKDHASALREMEQLAIANHVSNLGISDASMRLAKTGQELHSILRSRSWRLTAPARAVMRTLQKMIN